MWMSVYFLFICSESAAIKLEQMDQNSWLENCSGTAQKEK